MITATSVFDGYAERDAPLVDVMEFSQQPFLHLRGCMRGLARLLDGEHDLDPELYYLVHGQLSLWLTTPIVFAELDDAWLGRFGSPSEIRNRYGSDLHGRWQDVRDAIHDVRQTDNPLRRELIQRFAEQPESRGTYAVFCHKAAAQYYATLAAEAGAQFERSQFVHSWRDYEAMDQTGTLVKVGPLRSRGWGSVPHCVLSAPRYNRLLQLIWEGCRDEEHFGYRLVQQPTRTTRKHTLVHSTAALGERAAGAALRAGTLQDIRDDLAPAQRLEAEEARRRAVLIHVSDGQGGLYARGAQVAIAYPEQGTIRVEEVAPKDGFPPGSFVFSTELDDVDLRGAAARDGVFASEWKSLLVDHIRKDRSTLRGRLRLAGVDHQNLNWCIDYWTRSATSVIHAPKHYRHFKALMDVLGFSGRQAPGNVRMSWTDAAWREVKRSRGQAIQAGVEEHALLNQELFALISGLLAADPTLLESNGGRLRLPPGQSFAGDIVFHRILDVEEGFLAPDDILGIIKPSIEFEEWRS